MKKSSQQTQDLCIDDSGDHQCRNFVLPDSLNPWDVSKSKSIHSRIAVTCPFDWARVAASLAVLRISLI